MLDKAPPLIRERFGRAVPRRTALTGDDADVTLANADAFHRFKIARDAVLCNLAVHPVPVAAGLGCIRWLSKIRFQRASVCSTSQQADEQEM